MHRLLHSGLLACLTLLCSAQACAATVQFGSRSLSVPPPAGFEAIAAKAPAYIAAAQAYLPAQNQLLDAYAAPAEVQALAAGRPTELQHYFQLQAPRAFLGKPLAADDFAAGSAEIERGMAQEMQKADALADRLTQQGNAAMKRQTDVDPNISLSGIRYLGAYRHEPWGMFFSLRSRVAGPRGSEEQVGSGAFALINHQVLYLYAYAPYRDEADRKSIEQALSAWADALHAANPDDPAVAATAHRFGNDNSVYAGAVVGAIGGVALGLLIRRLRRNRNAA